MAAGKKDKERDREKEKPVPQRRWDEAPGERNPDPAEQQKEREEGDPQKK